MDITRKIEKRDKFLEVCSAFALKIREHEEELIKLLVSYETYNTAYDEIERSLEVLEGAKAELSPIKEPLENLTIATFFPLNLPLYSLILFGIMPSIFSKNVFIRPPQVMEEILAQLWDILKIPEYFPEVSLKIAPRHIFVDLYASESDVIIFTGKYENALDIQKHCPYSLLLYNGSGVNPFLLFENADVDLAAKKAVEMRCFNSGQDCAGPDAFIVPSSIREEFVKKLVYYLRDIKVGNTIDPSTNVGPTVKEAYIRELSQWLSQDHGKIIYGGKIDAKNHFVYPTIAVEKVTERTTDSFHEFFAPFFYVLEYSSDAELESIINLPKFKERGMYVSIFGDNRAVEERLDFVKILRNKIVNDVERGNEEYGGYGPKANFLLYGDQKIVKPVLVSRDIHVMLAQ